MVESPNLTYNDLVSAATDQKCTMKAVAEAEEKKRKRIMPGSTGSGGFGSAQGSCVNLSSSSIGAINRSTNSGSFNHICSSSSTVLLLHCRTKLQSGHHSRLPQTAFRAPTMERWGILLTNAAIPNKEIHHNVVNQQRGL
jgi:hypothetical protein